MDATKIGRFIGAERRAKGWTQRQLADKLQLTDKAISRWETGKGLPDVSLLLPLANVLDITVGELLAGERRLQPPAMQTAEAEARTTRQLVDYTRELGPQLRRRRACTVLAGLLLFAAAFLTLQFLRLVLTGGAGIHGFGIESLFITRCSSVCFYNIRLLAAATALHRCHDRGASLPPRIGHGRGWAVVARFVLCRSVCRVCCVPCVGFLASPIVAGKFKSRTISANRTISVLSCSRSRVS